MKILTTDNIKNEIEQRLTENKITNKLIILSHKPTNEEIFYKNILINKCQNFDIKYVDKEFKENESPDKILAYLDQFQPNDGFIIMQPFGNYEKLDTLRDKIDLIDLDGFTYKSQGLSSFGNFNYLPATSKAIVRFLDQYDIMGKNIVIANRSNVIGIPLANYLIKEGATVTVIHKDSKNTKDIIKGSDIFISAIGKAKFYDKSYFKDGQLIINVGTSEVNGKIIGDVDFDQLKDMDIDILTNKKGIGMITTLCLLERLID